jgi:VCBS repeat-containing protein
MAARRRHITWNAALVAGPAHGSITVNADGSFSYRSTANYNGTNAFTYRVNDCALNSNIATVSLTVTPVNDAPVARDGGATLLEDGSIVFDLRSLGIDVDSSKGKMGPPR